MFDRYTNRQGKYVYLFIISFMPFLFIFLSLLTVLQARTVSVSFKG